MDTLQIILNIVVWYAIGCITGYGICFERQRRKIEEIWNLLEDARQNNERFRQKIVSVLVENRQKDNENHTK